MNSHKFRGCQSVSVLSSTRKQIRHREILDTGRSSKTGLTPGDPALKIQRHQNCVMCRLLDTTPPNPRRFDGSEPKDRDSASPGDRFPTGCPAPEDDRRSNNLPCVLPGDRGRHSGSSWRRPGQTDTRARGTSVPRPQPGAGSRPSYLFPPPFSSSWIPRRGIATDTGDL